MTDPSDPSDVDGNDAMAHPDITIDVQNPAGDLGDMVTYAPDYHWASNNAATLCQQVDADAGTCAPSSKVGEVSMQAEVNRLPHDGIAGLHPLTITGDVFLTAAWAPGEVAGAVAELAIIDTDARNYGTVNQRIHVLIDTLSTDDPGTPGVEENTSVHNPRGIKVVTEALPATTPGAVDGAALEMHSRAVAGTLWGNRPHYSVPLSYNSADCSGTPDPDRPLVGGLAPPVEWRAEIASGGGDTATRTHPYSVDQCDEVSFAPTFEEFDLVSSYDGRSAANPIDPPGSKVDSDYDGDIDADDTQTPVELKATLAAPPESSTFRDAVISLPQGVRWRGAFSWSPCLTADTSQNVDRDLNDDSVIDVTDYVNCDLDTSLIGFVELESPLFAVAQQGEVFLEDTGGMFPAMYAVVRNESLGLNARIRTYPEIVQTAGGLDYMRLVLNATQDNAQSSLPSIPISRLSYDITGSSANGAFFEVASQCNDVEAAYADIRSWSDADADGDGKTATVMGPKIYFESLDNVTQPVPSPCLPVGTILTDNPADTDPGASPTPGDVTSDDTPSWTATRTYSNAGTLTSYTWLECSTDSLAWRLCGEQSRGTDDVQRITRTGTVTTGGTYTLTINGAEPGQGADAPSGSTAPIVCAAPAATVDAAIESVTGSNTVAVVGGPVSGTTALTITFINGLGALDMKPITVIDAGCGLTTGPVITVTQGVYGTWTRYYEPVAPSTTVTHTRIAQPLAAQLPLSSGDAHRLAVRMRTSGSAPTCSGTCSSTPTTATTVNYPGLSFGTAEIPFKVDTGTPGGM